MVGLPGKGNAFEQGEILRGVAVEEEPVAGKHPQVSVFHDKGGRCAEGIKIPDNGLQAFGGFIPFVERGTAGEEEGPVAGFQDLGNVVAFSGEGNALELVFASAYGYTVDGAHPKPAVLGRMYYVDLVVRKSQGVICTEVLVELQGSILVEPSGSGHPDVAILVFCKGVYLLVGKTVRNDEVFLVCFQSIVPGRSCATAQKHGYSQGYQFCSHNTNIVFFLLLWGVFEHIGRFLYK